MNVLKIVVDIRNKLYKFMLKMKLVTQHKKRGSPTRQSLQDPSRFSDRRWRTRRNNCLPGPFHWNSANRCLVSTCKVEPLRSGTLARTTQSPAVRTWNKRITLG